MSRQSPSPLTPRIPGTYRGRCDCLFWIVTKAQLSRLRCPGCGAVVRRATEEHFRDHNVIDTIAQVAPERADKKKAKATAPAEQLLDVVDDAKAQRQMRRQEAV